MYKYKHNYTKNLLENSINTHIVKCNNSYSNNNYYFTCMNKLSYFQLPFKYQLLKDNFKF